MDDSLKTDNFYKNTISFIIPVYNTATKKLRLCFESLLNQAGKNDEIIFVDDGSDLETRAALDLLKNDNVIIIHQNHSGVSAARNNGIMSAAREWLVFVDADDFVVNGGADAIREGLDDDFDVIIFDYYCNDEENINRRYSFFNMDKPLNHKRINLSLLQAPQSVWDGHPYLDIGVPWAKAYKRSYIIDGGFLFDEKCIRYQDNIFNMHALNGTDRIKYCDKAFYCYFAEHLFSKNENLSNKRRTSIPVMAKLHYNFFENSDDKQIIKYRNENLMKGFCVDIKNHYLKKNEETFAKSEKDWLNSIYGDAIYKKIPGFKYLSLKWKIWKTAYCLHLLWIFKLVYTIRH